MAVYHSFKELGKALNIRLPKSRPEKVIKCRKCGYDMTHIEGTNIYVCRNPDEKCDNTWIAD